MAHGSNMRMIYSRRSKSHTSTHKSIKDAHHHYSIAIIYQVMRDSGQVMSRKFLSVRRFLKLYADIMHQLSAVSAASATPVDLPPQSEYPHLCAAIIINGYAQMKLTRCFTSSSSNKIRPFLC